MILMEVIFETIMEFVVEVILHFTGLVIRWVCFGGTKSFAKLEENEHWNTVVGILFLIGLILSITLFFVLR